jgi:hypothetical protein
MIDDPGLIIRRILLALGLFIAILVMVRPYSVFRFLGDGTFEKANPYMVRVVQLICIVVAAGAGTHFVRIFSK